VQPWKLVTAASPVNDGVARRRTIVFSVHVRRMRPNVAIRRGVRGEARS
jgi:hypothetical protein